MHFLRTIFWVLIAVALALFAKANWSPVTIKLWGDIIADVKLPVLLLIAFLLGWLPTWLVMRARLWNLQRRVDTFERNQAAVLTATPAVESEEETLA